MTTKETEKREEKIEEGKQHNKNRDSNNTPTSSTTFITQKQSFKTTGGIITDNEYEVTSEIEENRSNKY